MSMNMSEKQQQQFQLNPTNSNVSQLSTSVAMDPFKALCQIKEEYIFVFSGFNERKLLHCEMFDT